MEASAEIPARQMNWSMMMRVGIIAALILGLVGYAVKVTIDMVVNKGIVKSGNLYQVDLKSMSNFDMDQQLGTLQDVPEAYRKLNGEKVKFIGEVAPATFNAGGRTDQVVLCYSVAKCCVGGTPKVQHFVVCRAPTGKTVPNFTTGDPVTVTGTLHVNVIKDGGAIVSVFQMDMERIEPTL